MKGFYPSLSRIYRKVIGARNFIFDSGFADQVVLLKPVLSVGNISVGGSGKTPVVEKIISLCLERGLKPCVIARNYKAQSVGIHRIDVNKTKAALYYGDEPFSIAQKFPEIPVFSGPHKAQMAQRAVEQVDFDLLIVDDGFQHRSLHRDFDLVLLDATSAASEDELLPLGRLREDFSSLSRSSLVALTKVNWAKAQRIQELRQKIPSDLEQVEIEFQQDLVKSPPETLRVLAVSGIANPAIFEQSLRDLSLEVVEGLRFSDHHAYSAADADLILKKMQQQSCGQILTTEKDFVKLREYSELLPYLNYTQIHLNFKTEPRGLYAFLDQCLRP